MTVDWGNQSEIKTRVEVARSSFNYMRKALCSHSRRKFICLLVSSNAMYGLYSDTDVKPYYYLCLRRCIEAFEMCSRVLGMSWIDMVTNEKVLQRVRKSQDLLLAMKTNCANRMLQRMHHFPNNIDECVFLD